MPPSKKNNFGYLIHDVARLLRRRFDAEAQRNDFTMPQWRAIAQLAHEDGITQTALAGLMESDPMTVGGIIERLDAKGMVIRETDPNDSRAKIVKITEKARALVGAMRLMAESIYADAFQDISDADRETTLRVLTRVSENLSAQNAAPKGDQL